MTCLSALKLSIFKISVIESRIDKGRGLEHSKQLPMRWPFKARWVVLGLKSFGVFKWQDFRCFGLIQNWSVCSIHRFHRFSRSDFIHRFNYWFSRFIDSLIDFWFREVNWIGKLGDGSIWLLKHYLDEHLSKYDGHYKLYNYMWELVVNFLKRKFG